MSGKKAPAPEGLVTSDAVYHGHLIRRLLLGSAALLVLAGAGLGTYFAAEKFGLLSKSSSNDKPAQQVEVTPAQAVNNAQAELRQASTSKEKAAAYSHLGSAYLDNNQPKDAVDSYNTALTEAQSVSDTSAQSLALSGLAVVYMQSGDTANEIKTIEALIPLLQQSSVPDDKRLAFRYQSLLDSLRSQQ